jgi:uncharacterized protein YbaR (Trm112 family)
MSAEILVCPKCRTEFDLQYTYDEVVSQTNCKCNKTKLINGMKPLDYFIKQYEVLNEKSYRRPSKVSKSSSKHTKK